MISRLISTGNQTFFGSGGTDYPTVGSGLLSTSGLIDGQMTYRSSGVLSNLYSRITANATTGTTVINILKNGAGSNQSLSIGAALTGEFEDTTNTDSFSSGDVLVYKAINGGGGNITANTLSVLCESGSANSLNKHFATGGFSTTANNGTRRFSIAGININGTETDSQFKVKTTGTFKNFYINIDTNSRITDCICRFRKNAANGNQVMTITAGITGAFEDTSNTDSVVSGDLVCYNITTSTGGGTISSQLFADEFTANGAYHFVGADSSLQTPSGTVYYPLGGTIYSDATENTYKAKSGHVITIGNLEISVNTNSNSTNSTLRSRVNGVNGNQAITITAGITGWFEDTTSKDSLVATDEVDLSLVVGTGGSLVISQIGALAYTPVPYMGYLKKNNLRPRVFAPGSAR